MVGSRVHLEPVRRRTGPQPCRRSEQCEPRAEEAGSRICARRSSSKCARTGSACRRRRRALKASGEAVAQAEENLRMSRELYGAGLATNTQVLDAVALQVNAVNNRDNAVLDESLSQLRLARASGSAVMSSSEIGTMPSPTARTPWTWQMLRNLVLLLGFKAFALTVLWFLFFSDAHRPATDAIAVGRALGIPASEQPHDTEHLPGGIAMIDIDVVTLSRLQFALTALYHFLFVPLTLGLSMILVIMESVYVMTGREIWQRMTQFWGVLFGINFAMGVATGITMEFQFGTNWAYYAHYVGDIFGAAARHRRADGVLSRVHVSSACSSLAGIVCRRSGI